MPLCRLCVRLFSAAVAGLSALPMPLAAPAAVESAPDAIRVGVMAYSPPWYDGAFIDETLRYLEWKMPAVRFSVEYASPEKLSALIENRQVDLVASGAAFFMSQTRSLRDLASLVSDTGKGANEGTAAAVIVRRDRADLQGLADLKGRRLAVVGEESSPGLWEVAAEVARRGEDPDAFFGDVVTEKPLAMKRILHRVLKGEADAGVVRACFLEDLWRAGNEDYWQNLRVLPPPEGASDGLVCRHSTAVYPGWLLASTKSLSEDLAREVTALLLTKPVNAWGQYWSMTTDYSEVLSMMKTLKIGPYAYLRDWTPARLWAEYWPFITMLLLAIAGLAAHSFLVERAVRRRTAELVEANVSQQAAERKARETTEKFEALQRLGVIGQMSSIVAHEMKQPLAAIQNLSRGAERAMEERSEPDDVVTDALAGIGREAARAAAIVDRVRSYGQGRSRRERLRADLALKSLITQFQNSGRRCGAVVTAGRIDAGELVIDPVDFELIVLNLLKNAAEAALASPRPVVEASLVRRPGELVLSVADNGPPLTDEAFARLGAAPLASAKEAGLGLGITIVRNLAESYLGRLHFRRGVKAGVVADIIFPDSALKETS